MIVLFKKIILTKKFNDTVPGINEVLGEIDSLWSSRNCNCPIFGSFFWVRNFDGCPWELPVESNTVYVHFKFKNNSKRKYSTKSGIFVIMAILDYESWDLNELYRNKRGTKFMLFFLKRLIRVLNFILVYILSCFSFLRQYFNFNFIDILFFHEIISFSFSSFNVISLLDNMEWN